MANLTLNTNLKTCPRGHFAAPIADGVVLPVGALVGLVDGYADHWDDAANSVFAGIVDGGDDRAGDGVLTGETSDSIPPEARIDSSGPTIMRLSALGGTPTQAKVGDLVYSADSNPGSLTLDATGRTHPIGMLIRFRSATDCDVALFTPFEMLAQATA